VPGGLFVGRFEGGMIRTLFLAHRAFSKMPIAKEPDPDAMGFSPDVLKIVWFEFRFRQVSGFSTGRK
jgi:hypothetical protein